MNLGSTPSTPGPGRPVRLLAVGDNVVDRYPDLGTMFPGGNAVNVAVNARRLGAASTYIGAVGTDHAGYVVKTALEAEGVDTTHLRVLSGQNAAATVRIVEGNRVFAGGWAGVSRFRVTEDDLRAVAEADVVHTGECSMTEADLPRLAERAGLLSFDFSERPWPYIEQHARHADVAIASLPDSDVAAATDTARRVSSLGPSVVAVTLGAGGAVLLHSGEIVFAPAGTGPVVDTLGAGDAFIARLLVGLVTGEPAQELVAAATRYATSTCSFHGAFGHEAPLEESQPVGPATAASSGGDVG